MKVLVFSDSHGRKELLDRIISNEPDCTEIVFLGDGMRDIEAVQEFYPKHRFTCVKGNNDWHSNKSGETYKYFNGVTVFACHGDTLDVRTTVSYICRKAAAVGGKLALYGHTHVAKSVIDPVTKVTAVNPGAACEGHYCVIEFLKGEFTVTHKTCW